MKCSYLNFIIRIILPQLILPVNIKNILTNRYNSMTIEQLQKKYPYINWLEYITALLPNDVKVGENERVISLVPDYFSKLGEIIQKSTKRELANFLLWRIVLDTSAIFTRGLFEKKLTFFQKVYGHAKERPRWKRCIQFVNNALESN